MNVHHLPLTETGILSPLLQDYVQDKEELAPFYGRRPQLGSFAEQIKQKHFSAEQRQLLVDALRRQYGQEEVPSPVQANVESLSEPSTYTIVTGHQLSLFTGPLFFIYKIASTIRTAQAVQQANPGTQVVPVFWMATEDHDFAEISSFRLFGETYRWLKESHGPVGRLDLAGIDTILQQLPDCPEAFCKAYGGSKSLAAATRQLVTTLFGHHGLVTLDGDDPQLKASWQPVLERELFQPQAGALVSQQSQALSQLGYGTQAYARDINLFWLSDTLRQRIERQGEDFLLVDENRRLTAEQVKAELDTHPETFSPNVVLRPLYQEWVLPNLAYIGGPGEQAYWLQLKPLFEAYQVPMPVLLLRSFGLVVNGATERRMQKLSLAPRQLFQPVHRVKDHVAHQLSLHDLELAPEWRVMQEVMNSLRSKAEGVDPTLGPMVGAELRRMEKGLDKVKKKMLRAEKRRQGEAMGQVQKIFDTLQPQGQLQERVDNVLNFLMPDPQFIDKVVESVAPFSDSLAVMYHEHEKHPA